MDQNPERVRVLGLSIGLFANLNALVDAWHWHDERGNRVLVDWRRLPGGYKNTAAEDPFDTLFYRDHNEAYDDESIPVFVRRRSITAPLGPVRRRTVREYLRAPERRPVLMRPPPDRDLVRNVLDRHLQLRPKISEAAEDFCLPADCVGLHIRGPGKHDTGVGYMWRVWGIDGPPYGRYFRLLDRVDWNHILLATDSGEVRRKVVARYGRRVTYQEIPLSDAGEDYHGGTPGAGGRDLLRGAMIDVLLLARCRAVIHGNSNLSNFLLGYAPDLPAHDIYAEFYARC